MQGKLMSTASAKPEGAPTELSRNVAGQSSGKFSFSTLLVQYVYSICIVSVQYLYRSTVSGSFCPLIDRGSLTKPAAGQSMSGAGGMLRF